MIQDLRWGGLLLGVALTSVGVNARAEVVDGVAAVVNGDPITLSQLEERPGTNLRPCVDASAPCHKTLQAAAEEAVTEHIVEKQCAEEGITPTAAEVDNAIEDVQRSNGNIDRATLEKALQAQGMSMPVYRDMLTRQLCQMKLIETKVKPRISIGEDDIRGVYNTMSSSAKTSREVKLRDIYVPSEGGVEHARTRIDDAKKRVVAGEDFIKVAKETGGPLGPSGGDLGWLKPDDLAVELRPVLKLAKGALSQVIETAEGLHFLKIEDERVISDVKPFSEAHDEIKSQLLRERMGKATEDYLEELKRDNDIQYKLP